MNAQTYEELLQRANALRRLAIIYLRVFLARAEKHLRAAERNVRSPRWRKSQWEALKARDWPAEGKRLIHKPAFWICLLCLPVLLMFTTQHMLGSVGDGRAHHAARHAVRHGGHSQHSHGHGGGSSHSHYTVHKKPSPVKKQATGGWGGRGGGGWGGRGGGGWGGGGSSDSWSASKAAASKPSVLAFASHTTGASLSKPSAAGGGASKAVISTVKPTLVKPTVVKPTAGASKMAGRGMVAGISPTASVAGKPPVTKPLPTAAPSPPPPTPAHADASAAATTGRPKDSSTASRRETSSNTHGGGGSRNEGGGSASTSRSSSGGGGGGGGSSSRRRSPPPPPSPPVCEWTEADLVEPKEPPPVPSGRGRRGSAKRPAPLKEALREWILVHGGQVPKGEGIRYAHMATADVLSNGTLIAAWQASSLYEGADDQRLYYALSKDGSVGQLWGEPQMLPFPARGAQWSPVLHTDHMTGVTWLFYSESHDRGCMRPASGKYPELWSPGGDIMATTIKPLPLQVSTGTGSGSGAKSSSKSHQRQLLDEDDDGDGGDGDGGDDDGGDDDSGGEGGEEGGDGEWEEDGVDGGGNDVRRGMEVMDGFGDDGGARDLGDSRMDNVNGDDSRVDDSKGDDSTEKDSREKDSTGEDSTGEDSTEKDSTEEDSTGKDSTEKDSTGKDSMEKDSTEKDSTEKDSTEKDSTEEDSMGVDAEKGDANGEKREEEEGESDEEGEGEGGGGKRTSGGSGEEGPSGQVVSFGGLGGDQGLGGGKPSNEGKPEKEKRPQKGGRGASHTKEVNALGVRAVGDDDVMDDSKLQPRWTEPVVIYRQKEEGNIPKVLANKPAVTAAGHWLLPFWRESKNIPNKLECAVSTQESAGVLISTDNGHSWLPSAELRAEGTHLIEGTVVELANNTLSMLFRTSTGYAYQSVSDDGGHHWLHPWRTLIHNPDSKSHIIRHHPTEALLLAYNDHKSYADAGCRKCRTHLTISRSYDDGRTWNKLVMVEGSHTHYMKSHYPTLLQVGCRLFVFYSQSYSCCAPEDAELGIRIVAYDLFPRSQLQ
eukprot:jgi/Mesvir1/27633/Mv07364-RA.1